MKPALIAITALFEFLAQPIRDIIFALDILVSPIRYIADVFEWAGNQIDVAIHNIGEIIDHFFDEDARQIETYDDLPSLEEWASGVKDEIDEYLRDRNNDFDNNFGDDESGGVPSFDTGLQTGLDVHTDYGDPIVSGSGQSATYTGVGDTIINLTIHAGVIAGDDGIDTLTDMVEEKIDQKRRLIA